MSGSPVNYHKRRGGRPRTVKSVKAKCDALWSQLVRASAGHRCERCLAPSRDAHHARGRGNHRLRFEPRNGVALCFKCHLEWAEANPFEFVDWFREHRGDDDEFLTAEARKGTIRRTLNDYLELERSLLVALNSLEPPLEAA